MEAGVPQLVHGVAPKITQMNNPWVVRFPTLDTVVARHLVDFVVNVQKLKKIAILHDSTDYGKGGLASAKDALKKFNLEPILTESYNNEDVDFSSQLNNIKKSGAEGMIIWGLHVQAAQILNQAKKLGLTLPIFGSTGILQGNFLELAKDADEGVFLANSFVLDNPDPKVQAFVKEYRERFKYDPTIVSALAYESANLVVAALKKVGPNRAKIMAELRSTKDYMGVTGRLTCDAKGDMGQDVHIVQIRNNKMVLIK
jgi:branched-chain amino acid transport system substrate-binding protein